jgi:glycosyltransferase involved in cell wall biosynthesis
MPPSSDGPKIALIVAPRYLPLLGGMERECALLADEFGRMGYSPLVITEQLGMDFPREEIQGKVRIIRIPSSLERSLVVQLRVAASLSSLLIRHRHDIAFAVVRTFTLPALVVGLLKRLRLIKFPTLVTAETGGDEDDVVALQERPLARVSRALVSSNDFLNGLCQINVHHLREFGYPSDKIKMIPNGIDTSAWEQTAPPISIRHFLFLGRIEAEKGVFELIEAFRLVLASSPDIHLTFAGEGSAEAELEEACQRSGLDSSVTFAGRVAHDKLGELFTQIDCLVLPSYSEGMPLSVLEAASHHRALILTDVGDMRRLFAGKAFICPPRDVSALSDCLGDSVKVTRPKAPYDDVIGEVAIEKVAGQMAEILETRRERAAP